MRDFPAQSKPPKVPMLRLLRPIKINLPNHMLGTSDSVKSVNMSKIASFHCFDMASPEKLYPSTYTYDLVG